MQSIFYTLIKVSLPEGGETQCRGRRPIYANLSENKPMFAKVWYNNMWYIFLYAIQPTVGRKHG